MFISRGAAVFVSPARERWEAKVERYESASADGTSFLQIV